MKHPIKIKRKTAKQVTKLNLSGCNLKEIPENVFEFTNLTKLILSNNRIRVIPKDILKLKKLKTLDLANNNLTVLQSAVFKLTKLRILNLYGNSIKKIPKQLYESSIKKLIIGNNPIGYADLALLGNFCEVVSKQNWPIVNPKGDVENIKEDNRNDKSEVLMGKKEKKHSIFISYSHADEIWLNKVLKNLKPLQRYYDNLETWSDKEIMASDVWKDEIDKALNKATIAILIVSTDFVASDFIANEELQPLLDKAQNDGTRIMPLIVRPCAFFEECGLSKYQAVNDPKYPLSGMSEYEQENKLVDMVSAIKEIVKQKD